VKEFTVSTRLQARFGFEIMSDVGTRLRLARESAGVSLSTMAARTHYGKGFLSNVENGRRTATPAVILAYEKALGDDMDRRGLLTGLAASTVAPAAVAQLLRDGFGAALSEKVSVEDWEHRAHLLGVDYMSVGAAELQNRLARDLVVVQQQLDNPRLWGVAARMLTTYGKTAVSRQEAVRWYRLAATVADRSEDITTRVWVRGRAALALAYEAAEIATARELSNQALALSDKPTLGRLNALVAQAHVAGVNGDRKTALVTLDQARRVFDVAGSYEQVSDFAVPEWRFHTFTSMLLSRLGDPQAAIEQDAADRSRPSTLPRFATHIELHRALMLAKAGDSENGQAYARDAMAKLPPERHSLSLRLMLGEIEKAGHSQARH
jgi:transcriptional regulator with XRE-family HTH domain